MFKKFGKKDQKNFFIQPISEEENVTKPFQEHPWICLLDIDSEARDALISDGFNCNVGSLGSLTNLQYQKNSTQFICPLDYDIPANLHEYDIVSMA